MLLVVTLASKKWCKNPAEYLKPDTRVLTWDYSSTAIQWIQTWQGLELDGFQKSLCQIALGQKQTQHWKG